MGLIDDLKRQSEAIKQADASADGEEAKRLQDYQQLIRPKLLGIYRYLNELIEHLAVVDPDVRHTYELPGIGEVKDLKQSNYIVKADSEDAIKIVRLRCYCLDEKEREFPVTPREAATEARAFLTSQKMQFAEWPIRDGQQEVTGLVFQLRVKVEINILFKVDLEKRAIKMTISNYSGFRVENTLVPVQRIDDKWLDLLGNYILRVNEDLHNLEIDEATREAIRKKVEEGKRKRNRELRWAIQREQEEEESKKQNSFMGRLTQFAKGSFKK